MNHSLALVKNHLRMVSLKTTSPYQRTGLYSRQTSGQKILPYLNLLNCKKWEAAAVSDIVSEMVKAAGEARADMIPDL